MNLFWLDSDVTRCAQAHQDAHVGKMLLEAVQLLCTAFPVPDLLTQGNAYGEPWSYCKPVERIKQDTLPYDRTKAQYNHPCAIWTRATRANFDNVIELAQALAAEFRYRFGTTHGSEAALDWVVRHRAEAQVSDGPLQPFALLMPDQYLLNGLSFIDGPAEYAVAAYRAVHRAEKRGHWRKSRDSAKPSTWVPAKWTRREVPEWF